MMMIIFIPRKDRIYKCGLSSKRIHTDLSADLYYIYFIRVIFDIQKENFLLHYWKIYDVRPHWKLNFRNNEKVLNHFNSVNNCKT